MECTFQARHRYLIDRHRICRWPEFHARRRFIRPGSAVLHAYDVPTRDDSFSEIQPGWESILYGAAWDGDPLRIFVTRPESPESTKFPLPDGDILSISSTGELKEVSLLEIPHPPK